MAGFWNRLLGTSAPPPPPPPPSEDEVLEEMRALIRRDLAAGFHDPDSIASGAVEMFEDQVDPALLDPQARAFLREELAALAEAQKAWPAETDCDRLDSAFAALEAKGVISRQHFTCCGTCGSAEIWDEMGAAAAAGRPVRGYTFYHWQDTERAVEGSGLYLFYGAREEGDAPALAIAGEIVAELGRHGLETDWDGSIDRRIGVSLDWKRRRAS